MRTRMRPHLFLGGSRNPTTWRADIAIPLLEAAEVSYYNPQVEDWSPELMKAEADAKIAAVQVLFVIDHQTRAIAPMLEATEFVATRRWIPIYATVDEAVGASIDRAIRWR